MKERFRHQSINGLETLQNRDHTQNIAAPPTVQATAGRKLSKHEVRFWQCEGKRYLALSHIPKGERDRAIYAVGQYAFTVLGFGYHRQPEREAFLWQWLSARRHFRNERAEQDARGAIRRACSWRPADAYDEYPVSDELIDKRLTPEQAKYANLQRSNEARAKIQAALRALVAEGSRISCSALERQSGCDWKTVKKHRDIWAGYAITPWKPLTVPGCAEDISWQPPAAKRSEKKVLISSGQFGGLSLSNASPRGLIGTMPEKEKKEAPEVSNMAPARYSRERWKAFERARRAIAPWQPPDAAVKATVFQIRQELGIVPAAPPEVPVSHMERVESLGACDEDWFRERRAEIDRLRGKRGK